MSPAEPAVVQFREVTATRGGKRVLADLDLVVGPGEKVGISGANGSGKSTLLRTIATLVPVTSGKALVFDKPARQPHLRATRTRIALMGHQPAALPRLSLLENVEHACRLSGLDDTRARRALDVVGLGQAATTRAQDSSFGMLRRAEIALALLREPKLLLLDEALAGLDTNAEGLFDSLIVQVLDRGGAVILVSHDETVIRNRCDRSLTMVHGKLEGSG